MPPMGPYQFARWLDRGGGPRWLRLIVLAFGAGLLGLAVLLVIRGLFGMIFAP